jgi:hypothetical protein
LKVKNQLKKAYDQLVKDGRKPPFYVVNIMPIRCLMPCGSGSCICISTIENGLCLVDSSGKESYESWKKIQDEFFNNELEKLYKENNV